jgi:hypothetical protein
VSCQPTGPWSNFSPLARIIRKLPSDAHFRLLDKDGNSCCLNRLSLNNTGYNRNAMDVPGKSFGRSYQRSVCSKQRAISVSQYLVGASSACDLNDFNGLNDFNNFPCALRLSSIPNPQSAIRNPKSHSAPYLAYFLHKSEFNMVPAKDLEQSPSGDRVGSTFSGYYKTAPPTLTARDNLTYGM